MTVVCAFCKQPIDPSDRLAWRRVAGWERKAHAETRKSGSDIALREPVGEHAHDHCVRRLRLGLSPDQESLL